MPVGCLGAGFALLSANFALLVPVLGKQERREREKEREREQKKKEEKKDQDPRRCSPS